jgi:hypothetical protein
VAARDEASVTSKVISLCSQNTIPKANLFEDLTSIKNARIIRAREVFFVFTSTNLASKGGEFFGPLGYL